MAARMITPAGQGIEVKARQKLAKEGTVDELMTAIQDNFDKQRAAAPDSEEEKVPVISDLDISQNKCTFEEFDFMFSALAGVDIRRLRLFGCATIDDNVCSLIADYFRSTAGHSAPLELHLSDCAITSDGFYLLMNGIEELETLPAVNPRTQRRTPLYMRLENNYIKTEAIQEKVDAGILRPFKKSGGSSREMPPDSIVKVDLILQKEGFQQKEGEPPAPEDAPPPKPVKEWHEWRDREPRGDWGVQREIQWPMPIAPPMGMWQMMAKGKGKGIIFPGPRPAMQPIMPLGKSGPAVAGLPRMPGPVGAAAPLLRTWQMAPKDDVPQKTALDRPQYRPVAKGAGMSGQEAKPAAKPVFGKGSIAGASPPLWKPRPVVKAEVVQEKASKYETWKVKKTGTWEANKYDTRDAEPREQENASGQFNLFGNRAALKAQGSVDSGTDSAYGKKWARQGSGGAQTRADDRSRTPTWRRGRKQEEPEDDMDEGELPEPWQEHWSDAYQIPYFWNSKSGESSWERPKA